ncbi:MAG: hypothetical protein OEV20_10115 [Actinomycetota bacterium]|nr:hypothetical protein [Actinomycetota bacterium]
MRNPIRPKNLKPRFWPAYLAGALALALSAPTPGSVLAGLPLLAAGIAVRSWGAGHLVKNDLLICSGPYAHVRHPFYLGTLCIGVGFAVMLGGRSALVSLALLLPWFFGFYFPRKERIEASRLADLYGEAFERYREAVPALWPTRPAYASGDAARWSWSRYDANNELGTLLACLAGFALVGIWAVARG